MPTYRNITTNDYKSGIGPRGARYSSLGSRIVLGSKTRATLETRLASTNNDLLFTAAVSGLGGNSISITYRVSGNNTPLSVDVTDTDIVVNVATDGSAAATSTAARVADAIARDVDAAALVSAANASGNDGSGVVAALARTSLAGGLDYRIGR